MSETERSEVWEFLATAQRAIQQTMSPDGFNLGANLGQVAGAGVPGHFHLHLVPRWEGDANFMTTVGATRVIPEDLADTWEKASSCARFLPPGERSAAMRGEVSSPSRARRRGDRSDQVHFRSYLGSRHAAFRTTPPSSPSTTHGAAQSSGSTQGATISPTGLS